MNNKLQQILSEDIYGLPFDDLSGGQKLTVDEAIATIKRSFLEMESMQKERPVSAHEKDHWSVLDEKKYVDARNGLRRAIRKEVNHDIEAD